MELRGERLRTAITAALLSALTLACGGDSPTEPEPEGPPGGWIYYLSERVVDGTPRVDLYRIHPDGTGEERLFGEDYRLVTELEFRPDHGRLAAVGIDDEPFRTHIVTMDPDGADQADLTAALDAFKGEEVSWSPTGDRLAFADFSPGVPYIAALSQEGVVTPLTPADDAAERFPSWSPRGDRIAFSNEDAKLVIMDADGGNPTLVDDLILAGRPAWTADGAALLFSGRDTPTAPGRLYLVDADGSNLQEIIPSIDGLSGLYEPQWLGDDTIFFRTHPGSGAAFDGLYRMRSDGSETELLLTGAGDVALSPDGSYMVVAKDGDLWVRALDGGTPHALGLAGPGFDLAWIPE